MRSTLLVILSIVLLATQLAVQELTGTLEQAKNRPEQNRLSRRRTTHLLVR